MDDEIPNLFFGFPRPESGSASGGLGRQPRAGQVADTNFYVWDDTSDRARVQEDEAKRGPSPGTKFVAKYATPNEVVSRAAALDGVAGALIALPDGLMVASRLSAGPQRRHAGGLSAPDLRQSQPMHQRTADGRTEQCQLHRGQHSLEDLPRERDLLRRLRPRRASRCRPRNWRRWPRNWTTNPNNFMAIINQATKELQVKIVYYGPAMGGKTTNLVQVHDHVQTAAGNKGKLVSLATSSDRTLFFDFLPIEAMSIKGFKTKFQLYTVPGQVIYNTTRQLVLRGRGRHRLRRRFPVREDGRERRELREPGRQSQDAEAQPRRHPLRACSITSATCRMSPRWNTWSSC